MENFVKSTSQNYSDRKTKTNVLNRIKINLKRLLLIINYMAEDVLSVN